MSRITRFFLLFSLLGCLTFLSAASPWSDSLLNVLKQRKDTAAVRFGNQVFIELLNKGDLNGAEKVLSYMEDVSIDDKELILRAGRLHCKTLLLYRKAKFNDALTFGKEAEKLALQTSDKDLLGKILTYCGMNIGRLGDYKAALDYYHRALQAFDATGNIKGKGPVLNSIGGIYFDQEDFITANEYWEKALSNARKIDDGTQIGMLLNNIGASYLNMGKRTEGMRYYMEAIKENQLHGLTQALAVNYLNLAMLEMDDGNFDSADSFCLKSETIYKNSGDVYGQVSVLNHRARIQVERKNYKEAMKLYKKAIDGLRAMNSPVMLRTTLQEASVAYEFAGDHKGALDLIKEYIKLSDSLTAEEIRGEVMKKQLSFEFSQKAVADSLKAAAEEEILQEQLEGRNQMLGISLVALVVVLILGFIAYRAFISNREAKIEIASQKSEVEKQRAILEVKNKDITDSIQYARHIQNAILPPDDRVYQLLGDCFVLYLPKDIVSGDFYWVEGEDKVVFAAVDCTGHGVPGALMSTLAYSALNNIAAHNSSPATILNKLSAYLRESFEIHQLYGRVINDGMDIAVCCLDRKNMELSYAGARNPLVLVRSGEVIELKADRRSISGRSDDGAVSVYADQKLKLEKGDTLYIFTDGFADQFGGPDGKKFKYSKLKEKLAEIAGLPSYRQRKALLDTFNTWRGDLEQIDDVLVMGVRV